MFMDLMLISSVCSIELDLVVKKKPKNLFWLTFEQVWQGEGTAWQVEVRPPHSGSLGGISCGPASAVLDREELQSHPERKVSEIKLSLFQPNRDAHKNLTSMSLLAVQTCFEAFVKSSVLRPNLQRGPCSSVFTPFSSWNRDKNKKEKVKDTGCKIKR